MSAIQSKEEPLRSNKAEIGKAQLGKPMEKSAGATSIGLGIAITGAESSASIPGLCSRCRAHRNRQSSTAQYPNIFCSEQCEQEFVRAALASLTVDDCIRIHERLETLLMCVQELGV